MVVFISGSRTVMTFALHGVSLDVTGHRKRIASVVVVCTSIVTGRDDHCSVQLCALEL